MSDFQTDPQILSAANVLAAFSNTWKAIKDLGHADRRMTMDLVNRALNEEEKSLYASQFPASPMLGYDVGFAKQSAPKKKYKKVAKAKRAR